MTRNRGTTLLAVVVFVTSSSVGAKDLVEVEAPGGHPPLYVDATTIQRTGDRVSLVYVLNSASGSNSIETILDCAARTYELHRVFIHTRPLAGGEVNRISDTPASEKRPRPISDKSTWDHLAKYACQK